MKMSLSYQTGTRLVIFLSSVEYNRFADTLNLAKGIQISFKRYGDVSNYLDFRINDSRSIGLMTNTTYKAFQFIIEVCS